jgi:hypothetical protein
MPRAGLLTHVRQRPYGLVSPGNMVRLGPEDLPIPSVPTEGTPPREDS